MTEEKSVNTKIHEIDAYVPEIMTPSFGPNSGKLDISILKSFFLINSRWYSTGSETSTLPVEQSLGREPALASRFEVNHLKEKYKPQNKSYRTNIFIDYSTVVGR